MVAQNRICVWKKRKPDKRMNFVSILNERLCICGNFFIRIKCSSWKKGSRLSVTVTNGGRQPAIETAGLALAVSVAVVVIGRVAMLDRHGAGHRIADKSPSRAPAALFGEFLELR